MARFWYRCALFCGAALLLPLLKPQMENDEDLSVEDVSGHQLQLGVTFFAIAVMAWTFIAAWFCYCSPLLFTEESIRRAKGSEGEVLDVSRSVLQRVAQGFADFIVENSKRDEKSGCDVATSLRSLDFAKFEELVAVAPAAAASALYGYKGASSRQMFDKKGALLREGANEANESSSSKSVNGQSSAFEAATADIPQLDAPHLNLFKELLRDRLVANLMSEGQKDSEGNWKSNLRLPSRWFSNEKTSARDTSQGDEDGLEELLRELLQSTLDGPTQAEHESTRKEDMPFAASMAEHARTIGDKCFKEQQFVAAVHCYEVATLLCPSGPSGCSEQLASCHCNCASACLELGRYGDAISECHAALVLMPSLQLTTRALQRLAAAHICLKNHWEALRCLQNCLELEPGNALLQKLMQRLERQRAASSPQLEVPCDLVWSDICIQGAGFARDKGARKRKGKQKSRLLPGEERQIEREAGIWHTMVAHNSKLYIFGGLQSAGEAQEKDLNLESSSTGSEELQILDLDTLELFQSSGSSRVPQACYCHSATVLDNSMLIFGGSVDGLMVFDFAAAKWRSQPCQGPHPRRQGHSATAMEQGLCVYGGIELMEQCNGRVCNDAHLLDTKSWTWKKLDCAGTIPAARFGHTATKLSPPGPPGLLIIGGRDQMTSSRDFVHDHSGLHILDTSKRSWSEQGFTGKPPEKVFGHFACTWTARSLLLVTGEASEKRDTQGVELFFLDLEKWIWSQPVVAGLLPCSRLGHAVAAADERVYLFGGLILRGDQPAVDKTIYMLQTEGMRDSKISKELWDLDELERISPEEKSERQILGDEESPGVSGDKEVLTDLPGPETCEFAGDQNEEGEDEPELTFEELLEQEKAFFKLQSKKASFPRQQVEARRKENRSNKKQGRS